MKSITAAFAAVISLFMKIYDGQIDFSAVPNFVFWLKIGPTVIPLLIIFLILLIALPFSFRSSNRSRVPYNTQNEDHVDAENGYILERRPGHVEIMSPDSKGCCFCCFGKRKKKPTTIVLSQVPVNTTNIDTSDPGHGSIIDSDLEDDGLIVVYNQAADSSPNTAKVEGGTPEIPPPPPDTPSLILGSISPRPQKPQRRKFKSATTTSNTTDSEPGHVYDPAADTSKYNSTNDQAAPITSFSAGKPILEEPELNLKLAQRFPSSSAISSSSCGSDHPINVIAGQANGRDESVDYNHLPDLSDEPIPLGSVILANEIVARPRSGSPPPIPAKPPNPHFMPSHSPPSSSIMPASSNSASIYTSSTTKAQSTSDTTSDGESGVSLNCDEGGTTDSQSVQSLAPESELSRSLKRNARLRGLVKDNDLEVIDEFSHTMDRLKSALKSDEARLLEESFSKIEQIVANSERVPKSISMSVDVGSHPQLDSIMSDLESVIEDINTWDEY